MLSKLISVPFQMSDLGSRAIGLDAARRHAESVFKRFADGAIKDPGKGMDRLLKELRLGEFGHFTNKELLADLPKALRGDRMDFIKKYAAESVDAEMFNYNRWNRSYLHDLAKGNQAVAMAVRFTSWPLYYTHFMKGAIREASNGNLDPIRKLAGMSLAWLATMSAATGVDNETVAGMARYGIGRTPFISPATGVYSFATRDLGGIALPTISIVPWMFLKTVNATAEMFGKTGKTGLDYMENEAARNMKMLFPYKQIRTLLED